jgi:hypothetical protein
MEPPRKALSYQRFSGFEPKRSNPPKALWLSELAPQKPNCDGCFSGGFSDAVLPVISTEGVIR